MLKEWDNRASDAVAGIMCAIAKFELAKDGGEENSKCVEFALRHYGTSKASSVSSIDKFRFNAQLNEILSSV